MKRIILAFSLLFAFASGLSAANDKLDQKLKKLKQDQSGDERVVVIIQSSDPNSLPTKVAGLKGQTLKTFVNLGAVTAEIKLKDLDNLINDPAITVISFDEAVKANSIADGLEPANSSSGALAALTKWGAAGAGIGVAIIDSGIAKHSDLDQNVFATLDWVDGGANRDDGFGHGTHVAGVVAGTGRVNSAFAGIAPAARLANLRVLDSNGFGQTSDVIAAVDWVIQHRNDKGWDGKPLNLRVINLSLGHAPYESATTDPLTTICRKAVAAGIVVVAAAGNYGRDANGNQVRGGITSPGTEPSIITVGAVSTFGSPSRADDVLASYSSLGPTIDNIMKPDIVAPGSKVVGPLAANNTLLKTYPQIQIDRNYMWLSGTSMATPIVSGAVAMMLSAQSNLTPNTVKAILMFTAEKKDPTLGTGAGYLNVAGAMDVTKNINPMAAKNSFWVKDPLQMAASASTINLYSFPWGQTIVWDETLYYGTFIYYNQPAFGLTIVWGDDTAWASTIVWESDVAALTTMLVAKTIIWEDSLFQTIVWDLAF